MMTSFLFFKIILTEDMKKQLDLPKKFVRLHGEALSNTIFLKLPCGQQWNIGLLKSNGIVYLHEGWTKFAKHYLLEYGHMLFFSYEGNSHFSVSICDVSTCEIEYPSTPACDSVMPPRSSTHKRMRTSASEIASQDLQDKIKAEGSKFTKNKKGTHGTYTSYKDSKAFEEASCFTSTNPFFRRVVRNHSSTGLYMRLPKSFAQGHLERKNQIVTLQVGRKDWPVKLIICRSGFFLSGGWTAFLRQSSLFPGDVCIYELIKRKPALLKVSIFKRNSV